MMTDIFVYDTYALIELMKSNPNYEKYENCKTVINDFIFAEFCYKLYRDSVANSEELTLEVEPAIIHASSSTIKRALKFRYENKKKRMSMTDCISYFQAKELGIKFLTGDREFKDLEDVEFVK